MNEYKKISLVDSWRVGWGNVDCYQDNMETFSPLVIRQPSPQNLTGILMQLVSTMDSSLYLVEQLVSNSVLHSVSPVPEQFFSRGLVIIETLEMRQWTLDVRHQTYI